ncbi:TPA: helix-turn-helix domain-containing protein, partial [Enterococcus faecium]
LIVDLKLCNRTNYAVKLYKEGNMAVNQICEITNVSRASLYRKLSEVNN